MNKHIPGLSRVTHSNAVNQASNSIQSQFFSFDLNRYIFPTLVHQFQFLFSALKGFNPKSATFRQHYYPEGGWGWVIISCATVVQVFKLGIKQ